MRFCLISSLYFTTKEKKRRKKKEEWWNEMPFLTLKHCKFTHAGVESLETISMYISISPNCEKLNHFNMKHLVGILHFPSNFLQFNTGWSDDHPRVLLIKMKHLILIFHYKNKDRVFLQTHLEKRSSNPIHGNKRIINVHFYSHDFF